ncbi:MAG TPA: helix-turn-helix transcriptional regulator [Methylocella sp.]|nr:helix-turn-helix transcriptional regulator [Methylocella sp.]
MTILDMDSAANSKLQLRAEEEHILASFTKRLIELASVSKSDGRTAATTAALNAMRLAAIAIDGYGCIADVNAAAEEVFDHNIKIKDGRLFVSDPESRASLKEAIDQMVSLPQQTPVTLEPIVIPRKDKHPVIVRILPFEIPARPPAREIRAILTLNALGPRPGPPPATLARTFKLTPSEAKLASIIARGAPPDIAARELKISRETARNQLKSVFAKTDTHRQSELVALLLQVE